MGTKKTVLDHGMWEENDAFDSTNIQCTQNVQKDPFSATAGVGFNGSVGIQK
jgi:hypothetical protein